VPGLAAVVPFYGIPPKADWSQVRAPVQMHVARRDEWVTPAKAEAVRAAITAAGGAVELHQYDADHAFMNERRPEVYDAAAAKTAWDRAVTFLRAHTSPKA
jgi:carboxymethylenebutenolidase